MIIIEVTLFSKQRGKKTRIHCLGASSLFMEETSTKKILILFGGNGPQRSHGPIPLSCFVKRRSLTGPTPKTGRYAQLGAIRHACSYFLQS